jgi:hypothetical protein
MSDETDRKFAELRREVAFTSGLLKKSYFLWFGDATHIGLPFRTWVLTPRDSYALKFADECLLDKEGKYPFLRVGENYAVAVCDDGDVPRTSVTIDDAEALLEILDVAGIEREMVEAFLGEQPRVTDHTTDCALRGFNSGTLMTSTDTADAYYQGVKWRCEHCDGDGDQRFFKLTEAGDLPQEVKDDFARGVLFSICDSRCGAAMRHAGTYRKYFG